MKSNDLPFSDRLLDQIDLKQSFAIVGLDPVYEKIPDFFKNNFDKKSGLTLADIGNTIINFNKFIIDNVKSYTAVVKPQIAFYEMYGLEGITAFFETVHYAKAQGLLVIEDAKRNDISTTSAAYSTGHLGKIEIGKQVVKKITSIDAITVNPYLGSDGIKPFIKDVIEYNKGIFILVKTSNPSSVEIQDLLLANENAKLYEYIAKKVDVWGANIIGKRDYSSVGAVVGATYPEDAKKLRELMPAAIFLVPGYGAQGGKVEDIVNCFNKNNGYGALISASRSIIYPHGDDNNISPKELENLVKNSIDAMTNDINNTLKKYNLLPW